MQALGEIFFTLLTGAEERMSADTFLQGKISLPRMPFTRADVCEAASVCNLTGS